MRWTSFLLAMAIVHGVVASRALAQVGNLERARTAESYSAEGDGYAREKQYDKAVAAYVQAIRLNPDLPAAHHGLGSVYINMGRVADAVEPLSTAVRLDPQNAIAHLNLGIALAALRRADQAMEQLQEAKRLDPQNARIHNEIGNVLHNAFGRLDEALSAFNEARRLDPRVPAVHHNIGLMQMRLGRFADAIPSLEEALVLDPEYRNARYLLSDAFSRVGRYDDAVQSWTKFLELVPDGKEALHNRAWNNMYLGHGEAAAADAGRLLQVAGWRVEPSQFMVLLAHLGNRQSGLEGDARRVLDQAAAKCDTGAWPYPVIRYMRGELGEERLMAAAVDNDKKTEAHTYLGMDLLLKGRTDQARAHFAWVKAYGNKRYLEYPLALAELDRIGY